MDRYSCLTSHFRAVSESAVDWTMSNTGVTLTVQRDGQLLAQYEGVFELGRSEEPGQLVDGLYVFQGVRHFKIMRVTGGS